MWGGGANTRWRAPSYSFAKSLPKNCMKMKEFGPEECVPSILPWILHCIWVSHERVNFIHSSELHRSINKSINVSTKMFIQQLSRNVGAPPLGEILDPSLDMIINTKDANTNRRCLQTCL